MNNNYPIFEFLNFHDVESRDIYTEGMDLSNLKKVYNLTDWKLVLLDRSLKQSYNGFPTITFFKAFALPYLINIPTERALRRELFEREALQTLCGFSRGDLIPTRNTFWHFRNRCKAYPDLMLKLLISMVINSREYNIKLPFVETIPEVCPIPVGIHSEIKMDEYHPRIEIWENKRVCGDSKSDTVEKKDMTYNLRLPITVKTKLLNEEFLIFRIIRPNWVIIQGKQKDTLVNMGPSTKVPYTSCNIIITREYDGKCQILLSKRIAGYGAGEYALPGGKQLPDENIRKCAERELYEETRIRMIRARPVSIQKTSFPGKPWVLSIGVLVEESIGKPVTVETNQHKGWEWHNIEDLPRPIFGPARIAIQQFLSHVYPNLQWKDIEAHQKEEVMITQQTSKITKAKQLKLF